MTGHNFKDLSFPNTTLEYIQLFEKGCHSKQSILEPKGTVGLKQQK